MRFDPSVLAPDPQRRRVVVDLLEAGLRAVDPERAVASHLRLEGDRLVIDGGVDVPAHVDVLAVGKAAPAMSRAAAAVLGSKTGRVLVVSDHAEEIPPGGRLMVADHPFPGPRSLAAGQAALDFAATVDLRDRLLVLISGGGSALLEAPADDLTLEDLANTQRVLMDRGVPIHELNVVRRQLSRVKNGGISRAHGRPLITLLISDVIDGPASDVASGPTLADGTTPDAALAIIEGSGAEVPEPVWRYLATAPAPPPVDAGWWRIVADGAQAADAVAVRAREFGLDATVATTSLRGEARIEGPRAVRAATSGITILAGETTVHVVGDGRGGRNQEAALAAAIEMEAGPDLFAAFGTDGIDGPTDAAGALVDGNTVRRGRAAGADPDECLQRNDSHRFLRAAGDLLVTGPTGTNVGDLWLVWRP